MLQNISIQNLFRDGKCKHDLSIIQSEIQSEKKNVMKKINEKYNCNLHLLGRKNKLIDVHYYVI